MSRRAFASLTLVVACTLSLVGCRSGPDDSSANAELTVVAASSLREVVTEIAVEWGRQSGATPRLQFEASSVLARQLREGADADVFISAAPEWVDALEPLARQDWLGNRLVLVVPANSPDVALSELSQLTSLALAAEQVPAGKYARAALAHLKVEPPDRTIYGSSVRDVLAKVSQGGADAGIVYATDAAIDPAVRISGTFPEESHPPIVYTAALLRADGRDFYDALQSPWAAEIAERHGFRKPR